MPKMSGATVPIVTNRQAGKAAIFVGKSRHTDALSFATDAPSQMALQLLGGQASAVGV